MTWIRTIPMSEADEKLRQAIEGQKGLYPKEYFEPVHPDESGGSYQAATAVSFRHTPKGRNRAVL